MLIRKWSYKIIVISFTCSSLTRVFSSINILSHVSVVYLFLNYITCFCFFYTAKYINVILYLFYNFFKSTQKIIIWSGEINEIYKDISLCQHQKYMYNAYEELRLKVAYSFRNVKFEVIFWKLFKHFFLRIWP